MKITTMTLYITEEHFEKYAKALKKLGWDQPRRHIFRKAFGNTSVEVREHIRAFSHNMELEVTFHNPNGCSIEVIALMLAELKQAADQAAHEVEPEEERE